MSKVIVNIESVRAAAEYLSENNYFIKRSEDEWVSYIYKQIIRHIEDKKYPWASVGGLTLLFSECYDDVLEVEVLVSPSFGAHSFIEAEIVDGKLVTTLG